MGVTPYSSVWLAEKGKDRPCEVPTQQGDAESIIRPRTDFVLGDNSTAYNKQL